MNLEEAIAVRQHQLQGLEVSSAALETALAVIAKSAKVKRKRKATKKSKTAMANVGVSPFGLTARQEEIMRLVLECETTNDIAKRMGVAEITVKAHLTQVFRRMNVAGRVQAAVKWDRWAREQGS